VVAGCAAAGYRCGRRRRCAAGRFPGFWIAHAHPGQPPLVIDAVVEVSVQLELADDGGWEVNPAGVKIGKSDGRDAGPAQALCWASVSVIVQIDSTPAGLARYRLLGGARFLLSVFTT
jgi:hypothetical protein